MWLQYTARKVPPTTQRTNLQSCINCCNCTWLSMSGVVRHTQGKSARAQGTINMHGMRPELFTLHNLAETHMRGPMPTAKAHQLLARWPEGKSAGPALRTGDHLLIAAGVASFTCWPVGQKATEQVLHYRFAHLCRLMTVSLAPHPPCMNTQQPQPNSPIYIEKVGEGQQLKSLYQPPKRNRLCFERTPPVNSAYAAP